MIQIIAVVFLILISIVMFLLVVIYTLIMDIIKYIGLIRDGISEVIEKTS